jgi:hypothetical protein
MKASDPYVRLIRISGSSVRKLGRDRHIRDLCWRTVLPPDTPYGALAEIKWPENEVVEVGKAGV